ncbi:hypothetical protein VCRLGP7_630036 [Vibrio crassostreae]|nr:hypothetical protein VCRLGP7_630036 [Vibrio crassostreae]
MAAKGKVITNDPRGSTDTIFWCSAHSGMRIGDSNSFNHEQKSCLEVKLRIEAPFFIYAITHEMKTEPLKN